MKQWTPKGTIKLPKEWEMRWGWTVQWMGWKRMLWLAFQIDFSSKFIGGVFLGLSIGYGKNKLPSAWIPTEFTRWTRVLPGGGPWPIVPLENKE
jgi:hypothetical protein